jgi:hypothetical protein
MAALGQVVLVEYYAAVPGLKILAPVDSSACTKGDRPIEAELILVTPIPTLVFG